MNPREIALAVAIMAIWGGNLAVTKPALEQMPPLFVMMLRFLAIAAVLLPFARVPWGRFRAVFLISVSLGSAHFSFMFLGLARLDAAVAGIITQVQVPFAVLLAWAVFGERPDLRRLAGIAIAFAGVALIAGEPQTAVEWVPVVLVLVASLLWAVGNIQVKSAGRIDGVTLNAWSALFATPQLLLITFTLERGQIDAAIAADWRAWFAVAYAALPVAAFGYVAWYRLLQRHSVGTVMPYTLLVPVFGVIAGVVLRGESFGWQRALGAAITLAGVAAIVLPRRAKG